MACKCILDELFCEHESTITGNFIFINKERKIKMLLIPIISAYCSIWSCCYNKERNLLKKYANGNKLQDNVFVCDVPVWSFYEITNSRFII